MDTPHDSTLQLNKNVDGRQKRRKVHSFLLGVEGKECSKCQKWYPLDDFHVRSCSWDGRNTNCKTCSNILIHTWNMNHPEKMRENNKKNYETHREERLEYSINNRERDKLKRLERYEKDPESEKDKMRKRKNKEYSKNPEKFLMRTKNYRKTSASYKQRILAYRRTPAYRVHHNVSRTIRKSLKNLKHGRKWETLVGYTLSDLMIHLEKLFKPGMSWDNYGLWEIDHIKPRVSFIFQSSDDQAFMDCWALNNLQPLWMSDNRRKHAKENYEARPLCQT